MPRLAQLACTEILWNSHRRPYRCLLLNPVLSLLGLHLHCLPDGRRRPYRLLMLFQFPIGLIGYPRPNTWQVYIGSKST